MRFIDTNKRNFKATHFIVVDENNKPMFWGGDQFVYAARRLTSKSPTEVFAEKEAGLLIKQNHNFRNFNNLSFVALYLLPIYL